MTRVLHRFEMAAEAEGHGVKSPEEVAAAEVRHKAFVAEMEAEAAARVAEGFVFHGCAEGGPAPEMAKGEAARVAAEFMAKLSAEMHAKGLHFVECGHRVSEAELKRRGF